MAPKPKSRPSSKANSSGPQRLQRVLASAGYGSRRQCEQLIEDGRVEVDSETVTKQGVSVDLETQKVRVDGVLLKKQKLVYYAVNKPTGVVTTNRDPQGRPRVVDLVPPSERVFAVGRLDRSSEGLILLTNDGELAQRLTHPKFGIRKIYRVVVAGKVEGETMKKMRQGIYISDGFVQVEGAKILKAKARATEMEITLREGKNREIRRILARLGHKVQQLQRIAVGPLRLGDIPVGAHRLLMRDEVDKLWAAVEAAEKQHEREATENTDAQTPRRKTARPKSSTRSTSTRTQGNGPRKKSVKKTSGSVRPGTKKARTKEKPTADPLSFLPATGSKRTGAVIGGDSSPDPKPAKVKKAKTGRKPTRANPTGAASGRNFNKKSARRKKR
ncbi:Ribosomal large subunit pseudouridine synthase B [Rubripirellula amarantea]|uniref:Pseudouridine synthase n=1 Tax=Rubripirellula amarantea TaxID=2527999 RepID=A0A5C5WRF9_9BACT|nr:pseudouridine synthase [Rubripirellula amarantea]TWT52402.1 Ribosomal large subunit pseudouridine synthase B [Rubripirellula amarantea]